MMVRDRSTSASRLRRAMSDSTSLGALVPPIGIFAAMQYYRNGLLDVRASLFIALGFAFGAFGGASLVPLIPQVWLKRAFATLLVYVASQIVFADPNKKMGAVLPGFIAMGALWIAYLVKRMLGKKPDPPKRPPPPPEPETEYYI